jgi:hypothetical protein
VVDAALSRDELSVVDAVFVLEAPLPLDDRQHLFTKGRNMHEVADLGIIPIRHMKTVCEAKVELGKTLLPFLHGMELS